LIKPATVDEAVQLLENYNIYFSGEIYCHFLIADASGKSVIVEYYDDGLQVVSTDKNYQIASNFIAFNDVNIGEGFTEFERYAIVESVLENSNGVISEAQAVDLLADVGVMDGNRDKLQWSVVYNLTTGSSTIFAHRNTENIIKFNLAMR